MPVKPTINWRNFAFVIVCFALFVPISINTGLLLGSYFLVKKLSVDLLSILFTSTIFASGLLLTHQTISYLFTNKLSTKPAYYILPFILLIILNGASSIIFLSAIKASLLSLLLVLGALILGGVILRNKNLIKFRIAMLLASLLLFLLGFTLAICTIGWMLVVFKVMMCIVFFSRITLASNYLVRFQEKENISEKQVWLSTRLVNETIFVYIAILGNIVTL